MIPLTVAMLIAGPVSGILSDRYGARPFATGGMIGAAISFALLEALPIDFSYWVFALILFFTGLTMASFGSPNRTGIMNSLPPEHRGAGSGMNTTFQNSAQVVSIGIFFTLMIVGLASALPHNVSAGLEAHGVARSVAERASQLPPVSTLFAAFLGYNPIEHLIGAGALAHLSPAQRAVVDGRSFFPSLISEPFQEGLHAAFDFAIVVSLIAAAVSWTRGGRYVYTPATEEGADELVLADAGSAR
jgi:MFS family permease